MKMKDEQRVIEVVRDIAEFIPMHGGQKITARQLCERFLFDAKKQLNFVSKLSGGERRRLHLLTILMKNPNFLILDEPTNDLDIVTLQVLEDFLMQFPGVVVIVSHDRHFMDKIVEHTFVLEGDGKVRDYPGNYSAYRAAVQLEETTAREEAKEQAIDKPVAKKASQISHEEQKEIKRLERQIEKLEAKKATISAQFNDMNLSAEKITDLSKELNTINDQLEEKEMAWMELIEKME
jgi:ATP-binding cassette subfamily F protein uup